MRNPAAVYVRISRDREGGGLGVARQRADCEALADTLGLTVGEIFEDNDLSAYSGKPRPGYRALLDAMRGGRVGTVLVWHTDRLHRSPLELEEWIALAEPRGVAVHTVKAGPVDLATPAGRMVARQLGAVARYESEHRGERVAAKREQIARGGGFLGGARPFGYASDGVTIVPAEAAAVAEATRAVIRGASLRSIAEDWNARGLVTARSGRRWSPSGVRDVLTRDRNAARLVHRGRVIGDAAWPPLVTEDELRAVVAVLSAPDRRSSPGNQPRWLGSGLYLCDACDGVMRVGTSGTPSQGRRRPAYRCRTPREIGDDGRPIPHPTRAAPALDEFVAAVIVERLSRPDAAEVFAPSPLPTADTEAIRNELARLSAERDALAERLADGRITLGQFDTLNDAARERQAEAERALGSSQADASPVRDLATADDVAEAWSALPLDGQRSVLAALLIVRVLPMGAGRQGGGGYFDPASVRIEWR